MKTIREYSNFQAFKLMFKHQFLRKLHFPQ